MKEDSDLILDSEVKNNSWKIRPCNLYKGKRIKLRIKLIGREFERRKFPPPHLLNPLSNPMLH